MRKKIALTNWKYPQQKVSKANSTVKRYTRKKVGKPSQVEITIGEGETNKPWVYWCSDGKTGLEALSGEVKHRN